MNKAIGNIRNHIRAVAFLVLLLSISKFSFGQNYYSIQRPLDAQKFEIPMSTYNYNFGSRSYFIFNLPFAWKFYDKKVLSCRVFHSGYLSFNSSVANDDSTTLNLPDTSAPRNAIFANWAGRPVLCPGCWPKTSVGGLWTWTEGAAPNRTYTIEWQVANKKARPVSFGIRMYENGDFIIFQKDVNNNYSILGCQDSLGGNGNSFRLDSARNVMYLFHYGSQPENRIDIISHNITGQIVKNTSQTGQFVIQNTGMQPLTGIKIGYSSTEGKASHSVPDELLPGEILPLTIKDFCKLQTNGLKELKIWADAVGSPQTDTVISRIVVINGNYAKKNILLESAEAIWCPITPLGDDRMKKIHDSLPNTIEVVAHIIDKLSTMQHPLNETFNGYFPNSMFDRREINGSYNRAPLYYGWDTALRIASEWRSPANVKVDTLYEPLSRKLTAIVTAHFIDYSYGDLKFNAILSKDSVYGYEQDSRNGKIQNYTHPNVIMAYGSKDAWGERRNNTREIEPGNEYKDTFEFILAKNEKPTDYSVTGMVVHYNASDMHDTYVMNSARNKNESVGINTAEKQEISVKLWPNPSPGEFNAGINIEESSSIKINIFDITGKVIYQDRVSGTKGINIIPLTLSGKANGLYIVKIQTRDGQSTKICNLKN